MTKSICHSNDEIQSLMLDVEANDGVLNDELQSKFDNLLIEKNDKLVNCVYVISVQKAHLAAVDEEIKRLQAFKKHCQTVQKSVKRLIELNVNVDEKIMDDMGAVRISWRKNPDRLEVTDEKLLIETLEKSSYPNLVRVTKSVDKIELKKIIQTSGVAVTGSKLIPGEKGVIIK